MKEAWIQLLTAFVSTLGFTMVFGLRRRYIFASSLGGLLTWGVYLLADLWRGHLFLSCLLAAAFAVIYAEVLARRLKTPATLFVVPAILPLVPGSALYYTMSSIVHGDIAAAKSYGSQTLTIALAIAAGISVVMALRELQMKKG
ncbi:MAG: threonine/serine exporter family protein [Oscillospiraceae bacterium]|nr:threonine/serine exporter family protein [Oscillospiraceae bacterium]